MNRDDRLDKELQFHLDQHTADLVALGYSPEEARRLARIELGGPEQVKEACRYVRPTRWIEDLLRDVRYALRALRQRPGFSTIALVTLALGIGANTAIFSLINAVLLRPLPVRDPDRLVAFTLNPPRRFGGSYITTDAFRQIDQKNTVFDGFIAVTGDQQSFTADGNVGDARISVVSGNFFETLGVNAQIGRILTSDDDRANASPVCVLGYAFWMRFFAGDAGVVGRKVLIGKRPFTIVGVTAENFTSLERYESTDVTIPISAHLADPRAMSLVSAFGRLKRGVSGEQAQDELTALYHRVETFPPAQQKLADIRIVLEPAGRGVLSLRGKYGNPLLLLMAAVGLVLLIACANVANLLMARARRAPGKSRCGSRSAPDALGAGRARLIRQQIVESAILSVAGASLGVVMAIWADRALRAIAPWQIGTPIPPEVDVNPDARVLLFTIAIAILVSILSGLAPAFAATRLDFAPALKGETGVRAPGRFSLTNALVVAQIALSLVLLIGAGLFLRSLHNLRLVDPGFDPGRLVLAYIAPVSRGYSASASQRYFTELVDRTSHLPGVIAVSPALLSPLSGAFALSNVQVPGYIPKPGELPVIAFNFVGPNYFRTIGTRLLAGRFFTDRDGKVAIVSEKAVRHFWPNENPIGKRIIVKFRDLEDCEVVGVVGDIRAQTLRVEAQPTVYLPFALSTLGNAELHVRVADDPAPVIAALRDEARSLDPTLPVLNIATMATQIDRTIALDRLLALLTTLFSLLAVALASLGLYGVMAFAVAARTREIGIRMALGADRARVLAEVLKESAALTLLGIALGVPAALWASRAIGSQLYRLRPTDPATYIALAILLAAVALLAAWLPARRASKIDPIIALRYE